MALFGEANINLYEFIQQYNIKEIVTYHWPDYPVGYGISSAYEKPTNIIIEEKKKCSDAIKKFQNDYMKKRNVSYSYSN